MFVSRLFDALYFLVYALLSIIYKSLRLVFHAGRGVQVLYQSCTLRQSFTEASEVPSPNHVALSGAIAADLLAVWINVKSLILRGTKQVTLHDPHHKIDVRQIERLVRESHIAMSCTITHIDSKLTTKSSIRVASDSTAQKLEGVNKSIQIRTHVKTRTELEVALTIVEGQIGARLITRAARTLALSSDIHTDQLNADSVTEWLDSNASGCMLPSEPDVVIVFPKSFSSWAPVLEGFPIWQLRLSQIVFVKKPIWSLDLQELLRLVSKASNAPKRFGR